MVGTPETSLVASIATVYSPFVTPFGCPRQGSICPSTRGRIDLEDWLVKGKTGFLDGLEAYSHLWVLFFFDHKGPCSFDEQTSFLNPTVRAPRALKDPAAPKQIGVFASRSPHRPNPIGQSVVTIDKVDRANHRIFISGIDICDNTQVLDLKPYHYADSPFGTNGTPLQPAVNNIQSLRFPSWVAAPMNSWRVVWDPQALDVVRKATRIRFYPDERDDTDMAACLQRSVEEVISTDVRTAELSDPKRRWSFYFDRLNIHFRLGTDDGVFQVVCVEEREHYSDLLASKRA